MILNRILARNAALSLVFMLVCGCQNLGHREIMTNPDNHLRSEKSPYLLQHADNPVNWYPWGDEAFQRSQSENKPIFLSIGYSTCHWCHVMEHESFEDPEIAQILNDNFISIKVDREERPDIDHVYMSAAMALNGQGGWPLNLFLTPDRKPFFAGTYFPPHEKWGSPGLIGILNSISEAWKAHPEQVIESSGSLITIIKDYQNRPAPLGAMDKSILTKSYSQFRGTYDATFGGFGHEPKFPSSQNLSFLLRYAERDPQSEAIEMVEKTLTAMSSGGIFDQLGGGFHRYSVDRKWFVPHFEKMLYDQAVLAQTYLEAYQKTAKPSFAATARQVLDYVVRDMRSPEGAFYSAEDADSLDPDRPAHVKQEGAFYTWRSNEILNILGEQTAAIVSFYLGVEGPGNVVSDPHGEFTGKNILFLAHTIKETSEKFGLSEEETLTTVNRGIQKLLAVRNKRPRPHLDDKILLDWNGLMISSLARGSQVLHREDYKITAVKSADFLLQHLVAPDGRLFHRYREGQAAIPAMLDDYAFFINGLIDLYEATFDLKYFKSAIRLTDEMVKLFWDADQGGFYFTGSDAEQLLFRHKEIYDGAFPSGNSMAALALVRLSKMTMDGALEPLIERYFKSFASEISVHPSAYSQSLIAYDFYLGPSWEIVVAAERLDRETEIALQTIESVFIPNKVVLFRGGGDAGGEVTKLAPFLKEQKPLEGKLTVYVCQNHVCQLPVTRPEALLPLLLKLKKEHKPTPVTEERGN